MDRTRALAPYKETFELQSKRLHIKFRTQKPTKTTNLIPTRLIHRFSITKGRTIMSIRSRKVRFKNSSRIDQILIQTYLERTAQ